MQEEGLLSQPLNTAPPVALEEVVVWFAPGSEPRGDSNFGPKFARLMSVSFKLVDQNGDSTAANGFVELNLSLTIADVTPNSNSQSQKRVSNSTDIGINGFYRVTTPPNQGQIWCTYTHPDPVVLTPVSQCHAQAEVTFTANGGVPLHQAKTFDLSGQS